MTVWLLLQAAAITLVFTEGSIFSGIRNRGPKLWQEGANCALCVGFWVGALVHWWHFYEFALPPFGVVLVLGTLGSGSMAGVLALATSRALEALDR